MGAIKNAMKKILPPPVSAFNREVERLLEAQEKSAQLVAQLSLQLEEQKRQIAHLEAQVEKCASLSASIQWKQTKTLEKVERVRKTVPSAWQCGKLPVLRQSEPGSLSL